ncbi:MAG: sigma 54-interacting transcriptional regulator [Myxococcota bacterium]
MTSVAFANRPTRVIQSNGVDTLERRKIHLTVVSGQSPGLDRVFETDRVRVGAGPGNDLTLTDPTVSSAHFEVLVGPDGFTIRDLGSTNGTYVSGVRILQAFLPEQAELRAGDVVIRFQAEKDVTQSPLSTSQRAGPAVGRSPAMREVFAKLERVAPTDATVLITGETGTGKEVVAAALFEMSKRASKPFVVVDCGAVTSTLIESELFGHEKGAFTGAVQKRVGAFERAHTGTLFLDEVGELDLALQPKLLRALERREIQRVGGDRTLPVDVRIIAATNRDLRAMVARGEFREDLYFRLAVVHLTLPALRERPEDIELLVDHFLGQLGRTRADLPPGAMDRFLDDPWPGNARELRNAVERAVVLGEFAQARRPAPSAEASGAAPTTSSGGPLTVDIQQPFKDAKARLITEFELAYVRDLLKAHHGNVSAAARQAGIDRMSLHKLINKYDLENPRS